MWGQPPPAVRRAKPGLVFQFHADVHAEDIHPLSSRSPPARILLTARFPHPPSRPSSDLRLRRLPYSAAVRPSNLTGFEQRLSRARVSCSAAPRLDLCHQLPLQGRTLSPSV